MPKKNRKGTQSIGSADPDTKCAWREYDADLVMQVWYLYVGGITEPKDINKVLGVQLHYRTVDSMVRGGDRLMYGPLALQEAVRCRKCGKALLELPCSTCGHKPGYHMTDHTLGREAE